MRLKALTRSFPKILRQRRGEHGLIARDMAAIAFFILIAKVAAAAKEMVVAWRFGTGPVVDAYLFVFNIIGVPIAIWYSVISVVLIPLLARLRQFEPGQESRFRSELFAATILIGLAGGLVMWLLLRSLLVVSTVGLAAETHALALTGVNYLAFMIPLSLVIHYGSVLMMTQGKHANSLFEGAPALTLFFVLLLWNSGGLEALLWGTLAGVLFQLILTGAALRTGSRVEWPAFGFTSPAWTEFRSGIGLMLLAQLMLALTTVVDQFFAADLGTGAISTLGYATRVLGLFLALGATTIGRATLPIYARLRNTDAAGLNPLARKWSGLMLIAGAAVAFLGWLAAEWTVRLLFERGAFTAGDTEDVATVLRWGFLQVPFFFAMIAAYQALFSFGRYRLAALLGVLSLAAKLAGNLILVPTLGLAGLMVSTAAMHALSCVILLYALRPGALKADPAAAAGAADSGPLTGDGK